MPATYTSSLRLTKPAVGDTNWGTTVNSGFTDLTDSAIAGYTTVSMPSNADYTLTSVNGAADEARSMMLNITSAVSLTTTRNVICPSVSKLYSIKNATTGGQSIVLKTSGGSGVTIPNGSTMILACNGTDVVVALDYISFSNLAYTGTLTGGTGVVNLGSGQFYKDASGNVGIGSTAPVATLELKNAGFYPRMAFTKTSVGAWYVGGEGSGAGTTFQVNLNASNAVTIDSSLNVGIGTTSPLSRLDITSTTSAQGVLVRGRASDNVGSVELFNNVGTTRQGLIQGTASGFNIHADTGASNVLAFFTQGAERARIDISGNLLVGQNSALAADCKFTAKNSTVVTPTGAFWSATTTGDGLFVGFYTEVSATLRGSIDYNRAGGLVRYNTTSDYRAKDIIGPVQDPGATIDALKVYEGVMKGATQSRPMLVAHEAQEHAPYAVSGEKDEVNEDGSPKYQQIDVSSLVPLLLAEIQSLRQRVSQLEQAA